MHKTSKIYIAGHRGLVGSAIFDKLRSEGYKNITTRTHAEIDLTDQRAVADFLAKEKPEYVFLAAARVGGIYANTTYPAEFIFHNLMIQANIIHQSYLHGVKKLLLLGSSCIYPKLCPQPIKEEYLLSGHLEPTNEPYAIAKIAGIKMCQAYNRQFGTNYLSVMPTNLYGPNDNFDLETSHVLPALIRKFHLAKLASKGDWQGIRKDKARFGKIPQDILANLTAISQSKGLDFPESVQSHAPGVKSSAAVKLWGSGSPKREFLHVADLAAACHFIMNVSIEKITATFPPVPSAPSPLPHERCPMLINIGTGEDLTVRELADIVAQIVGFEGKVEWDSSKPDGTLQKLLDVSRLQNLGWQANIDLQQGIQSTYHWYMNQSG